MENQGAPWLPDEEQQLINELATPNTINEIAKIHKRSTGAIDARQKHIAKRLVNKNGKTPEEVSTLLRIPMPILRQVLAANAIKRENMQQQRQPLREETKLDVLRDIRDLLREILKTNSIS